MRVATTPIAAALVILAAACSSAPTQGGMDAIGSSASAVGGFPGCKGLYNKNPSPTGAYYATDFGCSSNPYFTDPGDTCGSASCIQSAYDQGVCSSGQSKASCQRAVNWYSVGGSSYGCGARLRVTNPANGKSVVVMVLDDGPSCTVENDANFWVLDVSYPTIKYLFGSEEGWGDHARVNAVVVDASTPLGPTSASQPPLSSGEDAGTSSGGSSSGGSSSGGSSSSGSSSGGSSSGSSSGGGSGSGGSSSSSSGGGVSCATDGDCNPGSDGSGQICVSGTCVDGCNANWECPGSTTCVGGQCQ